MLWLMLWLWLLWLWLLLLLLLLWLWLLLRRRVCCDSHGDGRAWRGGCARGGCVVRALGAVEG